MINENFVYLAIAINFIGLGAYAWSTLKGHTKPNRVTWFLWFFIIFITYLGQKDEGVGVSAHYTLAMAIGPLFVLAASFLNKNAFWKISRLDIFCAFISIFALALWLITGTGLIAILLTIAADLVAGLPTAIKSFKFPKTENSAAYLGALLSAIITLMIIDSWTLAEYVFAVYIVLINSYFYLFIKFELGTKIKQS